MAKTRTRGISLESDGSRTINKIHKGTRIFLRLGQVSQDEAEQRLAEEIQRIQFKQHRRGHNRPLFRDGAARYLIESKHKRTVQLLAYHIQLLIPHVGDLELDYIHDGTLEGFKEARYAEGVSPTTINRTLEVVRAVLTRAARSWRDNDGLPWLITAPPLITMEPENRRQPHPMSWEEQDTLLPELPQHLQAMTLFGVNSGLRDENICGLRWEWERHLPEVGRSVFIVPSAEYKTAVAHVAILNDAAWSIIEKQRALRTDNSEFVFTYEGHRVGTINNSAWDKARLRAAMKLYTASGNTIPAELYKRGQAGIILLTDELREFIIKAMPGFANLRVHDLRHTYSSRLRLAGVSQEDRNALMGHKSASIPEHYASADVGRLIELSNRVLDRQGTRTLLRVVNG